MFTDSSFYNSKYHPTIADQVEMAHRLSSAMFNEQNKGTKGAKMYLTRMENSGEGIFYCFPHVRYSVDHETTTELICICFCVPGKWIHRSKSFPFDDDG